MEYKPLTGTGTNAAMQISEDGTAALLQQFEAPKMMPILSNYAFCKRMLDVWSKEYNGARPGAFILEHHAAGGHNAPPRNKSHFTEQDDIDTYFAKVVALGVPVYVAGAFENGGTREDFLHWTERGAHGIQVGSRFALCEESGMRADLRERIIETAQRNELEVHTSPVMSPTGFPIKYIPLEGTTADPAVYASRPRICNKAYLLSSHFEEQADGSTKETYICPAMPLDQYTRLGGKVEETAGRVCLCNGLLATAGYYDEVEPAVVTMGLSGQHVGERHTARDIVEAILTSEEVAAQEKMLVPDTVMAQETAPHDNKVLLNTT